MTQLSNVLITDNSTYYQNKLSVIKTSDNCVFSKADLRAINVLDGCKVCSYKQKVKDYPRVELSTKLKSLGRIQIFFFGFHLTFSFFFSKDPELFRKILLWIDNYS